MHVVNRSTTIMGHVSRRYEIAPLDGAGAMKRLAITLFCAAGLTVPVVVKAIAYTHFVTPNGSPTSLCTQIDPCNITRAVALIGGVHMPPGSSVLLQFGSDGIYSQAGLTFAGSGTPGNYIKFVGENGVKLTGTRFKPDPSAWRLAPGRAYTYQMDWDEDTNFISSNPAQRPPVVGWRPIIVEDRRPPFTSPSSRRFELYFPPVYANRSSVAEVEAQHCTHWNDKVSNKIYVHTCDDGPPSHSNNLYLSSSGWGSIVINGDYLWLENIEIQHASSSGGGGLRVNSSANGTVLRSITARATDVNLRGTNTLAEDLDVSHVILQGELSDDCYDANPDFGIGECWNNQGSGSALTIGINGDSSTSSFGQVVRRAKVHRSWNGGGIHGANTLEDSEYWGFPNHSFSGSANGIVVRNNVFLNGQDSIYFERKDFDDLTVEHNLFVNGVLFWVSNNGVGGTPPVSWRFRYNILPGITYDDKTFPTVTADCNLFIPASADQSFLVKVAGTDGRKGFEYDTLAEVQANTRLEDRSVELPFSKWTDGTQFSRFVEQSSTDFDFRPVSGATALSVCGRHIGPTLPSPRPVQGLRIIS